MTGIVATAAAAAAAAAAYAAPAAATAAAAAAAAGTDPLPSSARVIPFPSTATRAYGRLGTLCALACVLPGTASPPITVAGEAIFPPAGRCAGLPEFYELSSPGATPFETVDIELAATLAATINRHWPYAAGAIGSAAATTPLRVATPLAPVVRAAASSSSSEASCVKGGLTYAADVAAALRLQRNSVGGTVARINGKYDLLAISAYTVGVCLDATCNAPAAVSMVGPSGTAACGPDTFPCEFAATAGTPVVTHVGVDGVERVVRMGRQDLLALGAGLLADGNWLGVGGADATRTYGLDAEVRGGRGGGARRPAPTGWLDAITYALCSGHARTFVTSNSLCTGVSSALLSGVEVDGDVVGRGDALTTGHKDILMTHWSVQPRVDRNSVPADAVAFVTTDDLLPIPPEAMPRSLRGVGSREIAPGSAAELATAASLGTRTLVLPVGVLSNTSSALSTVYPLRLEAVAALPELLRTLASRYDIGLWGVAEPPDPASAAAVLLAVAVVLPEVGSLAYLVITTPPSGWRARRVGVFGLLAVLGALSCLAIVLLSVAEVMASRWRAAGTHTATFALFGAFANDAPFSVAALQGTTVLRATTLLVAARAGYAPRLLTMVAIGVVVAYAAVLVPLGAWVGLRFCQQRAAAAATAAAVAAEEGGYDSAEGNAVDGPATALLSEKPLGEGMDTWRPPGKAGGNLDNCDDADGDDGGPLVGATGSGGGRDGDGNCGAVAVAAAVAPMALPVGPAREGVLDPHTTDDGGPTVGATASTPTTRDTTTTPLGPVTDGMDVWAPTGDEDSHPRRGPTTAASTPTTPAGVIDGADAPPRQHPAAAQAMAIAVTSVAPAKPRARRSSWARNFQWGCEALGLAAEATERGGA
ncbi:hypothetical protein MMPV_006019 [Pyropia vietnamensis]